MKKDKESKVTKETKLKEKKAIKEEKQKVKKENKSSIKSELKQVKWPSFKEIVKYTTATVIFIVALALFFQLIDLISSFVKGLF